MSDWKHVSTLENPGDLISRVVTQKMVNLQLWWQGPQWLQQLVTSWPSLKEVEMIEDIPEEHRKRSLVSTTCAPTTEYMERFSSLAKLARVTVYVQSV
jgi:hypothetical protein